MKLTLTIFITLLALSYCDSQYLIGGQGQSCDQACSSIGKSCNARIVTNGNIALFNQLNISCIADTRAWWAADQPSYVSDPSDKNYGRCLGYIGAPVVSQCSASFPTVKRLCRCDNPQYLIGDQGQSCNQACFKAGKNCNPRIVTNNTVDLFNQLGISCVADTRAWWAEDQPSYASDPSDKNYGKCLGLIGAPDASQCSASFPTVKRLCRCDDPVNASSTFGTGYSAGDITTQEKWIFQHFVAPGDVGVLTHFWITYPSNVDKGVLVRYYIDGETKASIEFTPSLACGVGFYDQQAPWGTEWFGKGSNDSGWFNNFRIPFQKSIVVTIQHLYANYSGFYMIVRGSVNVPITVGGRTLPTNARMNQVRINSTYQSLDWVPLVNVSSGPGVHWMATIAAESGNLNFLEGCVHAYFDGNNEFPGVVLGTGTEDYFDSAWYFNAGQFHMPVSGFTHLTQNSTYVAWSAYRFHDSDPLFFKNGFQLIWRNGDLNDNANMKCHMLSGGKVVGNPTASKVTAYAWYYTWPAN